MNSSVTYVNSKPGQQPLTGFEGRKIMECQRANYNHSNPRNATAARRKYAPYSRAIIDHPNKGELIVCCGKNAWNRAKSSTWFSGTPKTVLPYQDNPAVYRWPVQNRSVMVFDFAGSEGFDRLLLLSRQLLIDGAAWVLLISESFPMVKIQGRTV
jgi:hypothetical protein